VNHASGGIPLQSGLREVKNAWRRRHGDIRNLNDRLNVINFASLFSGAAIASLRTFSLRLRFDY
jgi:GTP-dependent phosphoenolpyruvate carboxykinase